jgi:hypothetical protein
MPVTTTLCALDHSSQKRPAAAEIHPMATISSSQNHNYKYGKVASTQQANVASFSMGGWRSTWFQTPGNLM